MIRSADSGQPLPEAQVRAEQQTPVVVPMAAPAEVVDDEPPRREPPPPSPSPSPVVDNTPQVGSEGAAILDLETKLSGLGYLVGKVDGRYDRSTRHGMIAFQKVEGLTRSGKGDPATLSKLAGAATPAPRYSTPPDHLEIDIARQVVFVVRGGAVTSILPTSTGTNKNFTSEGWTRRAVTPNGQFKITRKINALRISPLGELYKPSYFNGGIAFHGNGSVPAYPASHGCVRLPMPFADWFFTNASPIGMVVYVYGGPSGPNPQPFIDDKPAEAPVPSPEPELNPAETETPPPSPDVEPSPAPETPEPSPSPSFPFLFGPEFGFDD